MILRAPRSPRIFSRNLPFRKDAEMHRGKVGRPLRGLWQRCSQETVRAWTRAVAMGTENTGWFRSRLGGKIDEK